MAKPHSCSRCPLERLGVGYAPAEGPDVSDIMFVGEALGREEAYYGRPFAGAAGSVFNRLLRQVPLNRQLVRVDNAVRCQPPNNDMTAQRPYTEGALHHCNRAHLQPSIESWLSSGSSPEKKVLVTLGGTPLRSVMGLERGRGVKVQDFHGTVNRDPTDRFWVVPTYHPSYLQRGAWNLFETVIFDLQVAASVSRAGGWEPDAPAIHVDPDVAWFADWVAEYEWHLATSPEQVWLAVDIETLEKGRKSDEGELTHKDKDFTIVRINFSFDEDEGVTVPWSTAYMPLILRLLASSGVKIFWNAAYDIPRLQYNQAPVLGTIIDAMWAWHYLQSDLPRGLGFVAPYYSKFGPWKHLNQSDPGRYAAIDSFQTLRCVHGIVRGLQAKGMYDYWWRHVQLLGQYALAPSEEVGWGVDQQELGALHERIAARRGELEAEIQTIVPEELKPLKAPTRLGWVYPPEDNDPAHPIVAKAITDMVSVCTGCGLEGATKTHKNYLASDGKRYACPAPNVVLEEREVTRYFRRDDFNVKSSPQVLAYIVAKGLKPGKDKKTRKDSANKDTIEALAKKSKDPLFGIILETRQLDKVDGTYVNGSIKRLASDPRSIADGRLHPSTGFKPSTYRLSQQNPNMQNVVADRGGIGESLAAGFRNCMIAAPGCSLIEADFSGIEAVLVGWFARDADYLRLAKLGIHAFLCSHLLYDAGEIEYPADLSWSDEDLSGFFSELKKSFDPAYNRAKRTVHATSYGMTPRGLAATYPKNFPTTREAEHAQALLFALAPKMHRWQEETIDRASRQGYLGGKDHPFGYLHRFYNVVEFRPVRGRPVDARGRLSPVVQRPDGRGGWRNMLVTRGEDAKRCIAFYPQSTAAGIIKETMLRLFVPGMAEELGAPEHFIGEAWWGRTPLRAQIHDSLVLEVPDELVEMVLAAVSFEMRRPIAQLPLEALGQEGYLTIGVEAKVGKNWGGWDAVKNPLGMKKVSLPDVPDSLAADIVVPFDWEDDEMDADDIAEMKASMEAGDREAKVAVAGGAA